MSSYCTHRPSIYAVRKLRDMQSRWRGDLGNSVRAFMSAPVAFPDVPAAMGVAFTANSTGPTERYCSGFCAIGYFQTPENSYNRLAASAAVRGLLQRNASADWANDIPGQTAVGLVDYRQSTANVTTRIPAHLRPRDPASLWSVACAIMGYVESGGAVAAIQRHAPTLATTDERTRFAALAGAVASDVEAGRDSSGAYPIVRAMQRLEVGRQLADATGQSTAWWYIPEDNDRSEHWLTIAKYGQPEESRCIPDQVQTLSTASTTSSVTSWMPLILGIGAFLALVLGAWLLVADREENS